ncbi:MAG: hypothetical protein QHH15_04230 [Candidatus Thermoplasmatota archaeon]|jgi:hypothetical protein|nr:hypothetical protein [Candidatus Thermoplasmatota archaeon]
MGENEKDINKKSDLYTIEDAIKVADDIFKLSKEKEYKLGAFIHGLILALEYVEISYKIPQQQLALIKRESRRYFREINNYKK